MEVDESNNIRISLLLRKDQVEWLKKHPLNTSKLIRALLDSYIMKYEAHVEAENHE